MNDNNSPIQPRETYRVIEVRDEDEEPKKNFSCLVDDDDDEQLPSPHPTPMSVFANTLSDISVPTASSISSAQLDLLAHDIVEGITVVEDNGIQTTTVDIGKGHFKGSKITIVLYDTHPTSYKVELAGSADAMMAFDQNLGHFQRALDQAFPAEYQFLISAALSDDHQPGFSKRERERVQKSKQTS